MCLFQVEKNPSFRYYLSFNYFAGTVQQALTTTTRTLTPQQHMQYLRRAALLKQQQQQQLRQQGRVPALQVKDTAQKQVALSNVKQWIKGKI